MRWKEQVIKEQVIRQLETMGYTVAEDGPIVTVALITKSSKIYTLTIEEWKLGYSFMIYDIVREINKLIKGDS